MTGTDSASSRAMEAKQLVKMLVCSAVELLWKAPIVVLRHGVRRQIVSLDHHITLQLMEFA